MEPSGKFRYSEQPVSESPRSTRIGKPSEATFVAQPIQLLTLVWKMVSPLFFRSFFISLWKQDPKRYFHRTSFKFLLFFVRRFGLFSYKIEREKRVLPNGTWTLTMTRSKSWSKKCMPWSPFAMRNTRISSR